MSKGLNYANLAFSLLILLAFSGCVPDYPVKVRGLPAPPAEVPVCNLPIQLHQRNERGPRGEGSCVHASMTNHLRWLNRFQLASKWWASYHDGETAYGLMQKLDREGADYVWTEKADPRFLDWASDSRRGCIIWWKPSHCCTFEGWTRGADGKTYACILDNNRPGVFEYTEREQFIRLWAGYGGFALTVLSDPPPPIPWRSWEIVD